jgi:thiol-disulfide isomerase/thioredoxin
MIDWLAHHAMGLPYAEFLQQYASPEQARRWQDNYEVLVLNDSHKFRISQFTRQMNVICLSGTWCGDCANQCPIFERIVQAAPVGLIKVHYLDRDQAPPELAQAIRINGGQRVPAVIFVSEDGFEVARYGEKTLAKYRDEAAKLVGASCSLGIVNHTETDLRQQVIDEWVDQFERAHLILRLSARLRQIHGD